MRVARRVCRYRPSDWTIVSRPTASTAEPAVGPVLLHAFGDESQRTIAPGEAIYVMAVAVLPADRCAPARDLLRPLLRRGQKKLHWRTEGAASRAKITQVVAEIAGLHNLVVIGARYEPKKQERARAKVLERLLWEVDQRQVSSLLLESRHRERDRHDLKTIGALRNRRSLSRRLQVDHGQPVQEPLLWLPDVVAGAVGDGWCGDGTHLLVLEDHVEIIEMDVD